MKKNTLRHSLLLLLTAAIWGFAFVAQSVGMDYVQPFTFTAARSLIGGIVLLPFIFIQAQKTGRTSEEKSASWKQALPGGIICGVLLCIASNLQQIGIQYTTVGKAGLSQQCTSCLFRYSVYFSQENRYPCVDLCGTCCMRTVSFMYDRRFLSSAARRSVYTLLCAHIFPADSCRGSLCTDRG